MPVLIFNTQSQRQTISSDFAELKIKKLFTFKILLKFYNDEIFITLLLNKYKKYSILRLIEFLSAIIFVFQRFE